MTYEERIAQTAKRKCDKLYISELIAAAFALTAFLPYLIFKNISFPVFSAICFSYCAFAETAILFIEKKARKHINRRLKILNKSLERTVRRFPQDELFLEKENLKENISFWRKNEKLLFYIRKIKNASVLRRLDHSKGTKSSKRHRNI